MNVDRVEFEKRNSGITWITFRGEDGIEVYPMNARDSLVLERFLSNPDQMTLIIRDHVRPEITKANKCETHGSHCPQCPESLDFTNMRKFLENWLELTKAAAMNYLSAAVKYGATPVFTGGNAIPRGYLKTEESKAGKRMFSFTSAE